MFTKTDPYVVETLAAERCQRLEAEAHAVRRADEAVHGRRSQSARSWSVVMVRLAGIAGVGRVRGWDTLCRRPGTAFS